MKMTQEQAMLYLKGDDNIFITGQPGTGKSYLTERYIEWLQDNNKRFAITASTGIAASNIGGGTVHSFLSVRNDDPLSLEDLDEIASNRYTVKRIQDTDILIVDEVSMMSEQLLVNMNKILQKIRHNSEMFGGIKVVFVGDFFQLPPVKGNFCFNAYEWKKANFTVCYLEKNYRQDKDTTFVDVLTAIRMNTLSEEHRAIIRTRIFDDVSNTGCKLRLFTHNNDVDKVNLDRLSRMKEPVRIYEMKKTGNEDMQKGLIKSCLSPEKLLLKVGAPVMFTRNDPVQRWVNGNQGTVTGFGDDYVTVQMMNGQTYNVGYASWERASGYGKNKTVKASISQIPLRLAWAITIHKSQGMTLDSAIIDVTKAFECGQGYVAMSRVRSLDTIFIQGRLTKNSFAVSQEVLDKDLEFMQS